jgi:hypothetical protein
LIISSTTSTPLLRPAISVTERPNLGRFEAPQIRQGYSCS